VARPQQLCTDPDHLRRLHPRAGDGEPAARAGSACERRHRQRAEPAPLDGGL